MKEQLTTVFLMLFFVVTMLCLAFVPGQEDFYTLITFYGVSFLIYILLLRSSSLKHNYFHYFIFLGCLVRVLLIFHFPNLSDDIYRFYWDGQLTHHGLNPYAYIPTDLLSMTEEIPLGINEDLYALLNSQEYYTIYPPFAQVMFYISSFFSDISSFGVSMKILFFIFELISLHYLIRLCTFYDISRSNTIIYFLNPLVIIEGCGNLHFEVLMISFLLMGLYYFVSRKIAPFTLAFVLAIAVKLTPLLLGPLFLVKIKDHRDKILFLILGGLFFFLLFIPLFIGLNYVNISDSINLYFRKFEFNASIYYICRFVGIQYKGYNMIASIGPLLGLLSLGNILFLAFQKTQNKAYIFHLSILSYTVYLFFATTVHPWYLIPIIALCVIRPFLYVIAWSGLIFLSYSIYGNPGFIENLYLVALEYFLVFLIFYLEVIKKSISWDIFKSKD